MWKFLSYKMLVWIIISNRFDSLRLTHIYTCQQGMSTRYFVISYNSIFFNRSYNVSTIYHPLRSSDIVGKLASKNQVNIVNAVVLLFPQASVIKGSNSSVCAHACVRACVRARARVCVCVCDALNRAGMQRSLTMRPRLLTIRRQRIWWLMSVSAPVCALRPLPHSDAAAEEGSLMLGLISG